VIREGVGQGGEMTQALYAHVNNKKIKIKKNNSSIKESAGINVM
jgi:NaMN:DMB phosphoribosyltransferase